VWIIGIHNNKQFNNNNTKHTHNTTITILIATIKTLA